MRLLKNMSITSTLFIIHCDSSCRCDADPAALSKYVIALLKKDKPLDELRSSMEQQMEVFLQTDTPQFIASLFDTIDSKVCAEPSVYGRPCNI